jgi:multidrug efflux pump subunit AcrB
MNLAARARPYFGAVVLTTLLLTAGGLYCLTRMPSGIYPEVTFPRISVIAKAPGLDVATTDVIVTQPLEQEVSTVLGVARVRSKTIRGGAELSLDFSPGTDMNRAEQLTWNRIGDVRSKLPAGLSLKVEQMTPSVFPMMSLVLTGGESPAKLRDFADYELAPQLRGIRDVHEVEVAGGDQREIIVEPNPDGLLAAGLSAADLADQIGAAHRHQPVGRVERGAAGFGIIVSTQGETVRQIEDLVVSTKGNQPLRVRDLAKVTMLHQDRVMSVGFEGRDAVVVTVKRQLGGNAVNVSRAVRELLAKQPPPGTIRATVVYDQATLIDTSVNNVRDAILVGGVFSILILLAFLRSLRATLISALALPTTLAITFLILYYWGETLNLMSLGGLAVAIGLIIDDTVVVIENIARHTAAGATEADPVGAASAEITGAVVGSTLTTVLVFVPLAFIVGVYGQFFASLSRSLAVAVLVSMVISLTLIPVLAARFLRGRSMPPPGPIYRFVADIYERALALALRLPVVTLAVSLLAVGLGVLLYTGIPDANGEPGGLVRNIKTGLMPAMDEGAFVIDYWAPAGSSLEDTQALAKGIEHLLSENPDIQSYVRRTGSELGLFATRTNRGDFQVVLRPDEEGVFGLFRRPKRGEFGKIEKDILEEGKKRAVARYGPKFTSDQMWAEAKAYVRENFRRRSVAEVRDEIEDEIKEHYGKGQLKFETHPLLEDELSDLSGANRPIEVKLFGPQGAELRDQAKEIAEMLEEKGKGRGVKEPNSGVTEGNPDLMVKPKDVRVARLGLTPQELERQLRAIYLGVVATQVPESSARITDVRVRYTDRLRFGSKYFDPASVLDQWILLPEGKFLSDPLALGLPAGPARAVPLGAVAELKVVKTPEEQWRENLQPAQIISAEVNEREAGLNDVVADIRKWMAETKLPEGYRWELGGYYLAQQQAFRSLLAVMAVAIVLVFIMLAVQFRSVLLPLLIFLTQPLSLVSGLFALWLTDTPLNVSSYMGAILLIGLDMKNGILLVEYIQQLRAQGVELRPALLQAGRTRFRPILMTSLAAILGLLPLALGLGPGAQMQQPLAIMVIGGLTANMLFTRMIIPVGYLLVERWLPAAVPHGSAPTT